MDKPTIYERRKQHLDSRLSAYLADPSKRAITAKGECLYRTYDGKKCLIGQDIPDDLYAKWMDAAETLPKVMMILPKEVSSLGEDYLEEAQSLHDAASNWTDKGLSEYGQSHYNRIVYDYCTEPQSHTAS